MSRSSEEILRAVVEGTAGTTDQEFFRAMASHLGAALELRYCFITECLGSPPERVRTLAFWNGSSFLDDFEYSLAETPCQNVLDGQTCSIGQRVQALFPNDRDLVDLGAESYAAVPLVDGGDVIGHLAVLDTRPFDEHGPDLALLQLFAARAATELARRRADAELKEQRRRSELRLRSIVEGTAATTGEAFFSSLVQQLAAALEVRYAVLGEVVQPHQERVRTLAVWGGDDFAENFEYDLAGSPCENVVGRETCFHPRAVQSLFPGDPLLAEMGIESYLGAPIYDSVGRALGLLMVMDDQPMEEDPEVEQLLRVFAARAGAELERLRIDEEHRKLQTQVLQAQKLESLGILAGGIAHDFNNLLVGILGNAEMCKRALAPGQPPWDFVQAIEIAAERAAELSNQMLAYSGKGRLIVEACDLNALVEEMAQLLETSISKTAELSLSFAADLPVIEADVTQVRQVIMNLITNASDSLEEQSGAVSIRTGTIESGLAVQPQVYSLEELKDDPYVFLEVSDSGCGMSPETRSSMFDPFFTTKSDGRGLGLAAVVGIVRGHRGAIRIDSELGRGTTFRIYFPCSTAQTEVETPVRPGRTAELSWSGETLLVIDDEEMVRTLATAALEQAGFEVLVAEDGIQALDIFRQHDGEIKAVLLDLMMPKMSGEQTFSELKRLDPELRVILSSGYTRKQVTRRFADEEPAGFLKKPYRPTDLVRTVREALEG